MVKTINAAFMSVTALHSLQPCCGIEVLFRLAHKLCLPITRSRFKVTFYKFTGCLLLTADFFELLMLHSRVVKKCWRPAISPATLRFLPAVNCRDK